MMKWLSGVLVLLLSAHPMLAQTALTLEQALNEARLNNPGLMASANLSRAEGLRLWSVVVPDNPEIFFEEEGIPRSGSVDEWGGRKYGFVQSFKLPTAYWLEGRKQNAKTGALTAMHTAAENRIFADVKKTYYGVAAAQERMALYEDMRRWAEINLEKARIRVLAGETPALDSLRARLQLTEAENRLMTVTQNTRVQKQALAVLLGRPVKEVPVVQADLSLSVGQPSIGEIILRAVEAHPLLAAQKARKAEQSAGLGLAWHRLLPSFSVKYFHREFRAQDPPDDRGFEIGASLPLWALLREQSEIRAARARLKAEEWQGQAVRNEVMLTIERHLSQLQQAEHIARRYETGALGEAEELARVTTRAYEAGALGYLEMIDALGTLARVKGEYLRAKLAVIEARANLELAAGSELFIW